MEWAAPLFLACFWPVSGLSLACPWSLWRARSAGESGLEHGLSLLGALPAVALGLAEEVRQLAVAVAIGVLDVLLQAQHVAQAGFGEPDQVVVLVLGAGHASGVGGAAHVASCSRG